MMAQDQLAERIIIAADSNNLLPKDIAQKINTYDRGVLTNEDTQKGASDDPKQWVKYLKDKLEGRYEGGNNNAEYIETAGIVITGGNTYHGFSTCISWTC